VQWGESGQFSGEKVLLSSGRVTGLPGSLSSTGLQRSGCDYKKKKINNPDDFKGDELYYRTQRRERDEIALIWEVPIRLRFQGEAFQHKTRYYREKWSKNFHPRGGRGQSREKLNRRKWKYIEATVIFNAGKGNVDDSLWWKGN